jgi:hypothetical protein
MNIFRLSDDPVEAAQMQCDKHVVKMILESGMMLSTAHRVLDGRPIKAPSVSGKRMVTKWVLPDPEDEATLYSVSHLNHPSTVWTREARDNYVWHYQHFVALGEEYTHRYGKVHLSVTKLKDRLATPPVNIPDGSTPFRLAMPDEFKTDDVVESYRAYYLSKTFKMVWTNRDHPTWSQKWDD